MLFAAEEESPVFQRLGTSRKQEIRYARRDKVRATVSSDVTAFLDLAEAAARKRAPTLDFSVRRRQLRAIVEGLLGSQRGLLFTVRNADEQINSAAVFALDSKRAYYLYGANHPEWQSRYSGTILLWDAFLKLSELGHKCVDLEGVNSPQRGWFKLSFGGRLVDYHQLSLEPGR